MIVHLIYLYLSADLFYLCCVDSFTLDVNGRQVNVLANLPPWSETHSGEMPCVFGMGTVAPHIGTVQSEESGFQPHGNTRPVGLIHETVVCHVEGSKPTKIHTFQCH